MNGSIVDMPAFGEYEGCGGGFWEFYVEFNLIVLHYKNINM